MLPTGKHSDRIKILLQNCLMTSCRNHRPPGSELSEALWSRICMGIFIRGLQSPPLCINLWGHHIVWQHSKCTTGNMQIVNSHNLLSHSITQVINAEKWECLLVLTKAFSMTLLLPLTNHLWARSMRKIGYRKLRWTYDGAGLKIKKTLLSYCLFINFSYNEGTFIVHLSCMVNTR